MKGRKPKPTYLKVVRGNPGKRPLNQNEPKPPKAQRLPQAPDIIRLDPIAFKQWKTVGRHLLAMKALHGADLSALEQYCVWYSHWYRAEELLQKSGKDILGNGKDVGFYQHPWLSVARRSSDQMLKFMTEFGLTPSSRSRIQLYQDASDGDEIFS